MSESIDFRHQATAHHVPWGGSFSNPREEGFRDTSTSELRAIVAAVEAGQPWEAVIRDAFAERKPWLHQIIASPLRTAFFGNVLPSGTGVVLDIGAGWGQMSRPLAQHRHVVAVEPVAERLAFIRAAAQQQGVADRIAYLEADYLEVAFTTRFEAICAIGVLEWAGAFQSLGDPQERQRQFLRKTRAELSPGGCLVLGIENRIGLKYLLGVPDDHIGVPAIACLPAALAKQRWKETSGQTLQSFTYSRSELTDMLRDAGYSRIEFFGAFPDYKLPRAIIPLGEDGAEINRWLATEEPPIEHNGYDGSALSPDMLAALNAQYRTLALDGVAQAFVPSFFVRAS